MAVGAGIEDAIVRLRVEVARIGTVDRVEVLRDPGHGFGREARACTGDKRWRPGEDADGAPVDTALTVDVHFER